MCIKDIYRDLSTLGEKLKSAALLFARVILAYGFYEPAMMKWNNFDSTTLFFASIGIPFATVNTFLAASIESLGVVLLALGLLTRLISVPLIVVMLVAIFTVHLPNGFSSGSNGYEIPLYYMIFLFIFLSHGAGNYSLDRIIFGKK